MNSRGISLGVCLFMAVVVSPHAQSASHSGQVMGVINNFAAVDNFAVALAAGWSGPGCGSNRDSSKPLLLIFLRDGSPSQAAYDRNYAAALSASFLDSAAEIFTYGNSCEGYGLALSPAR